MKGRGTGAHDRAGTWFLPRTGLLGAVLLADDLFMVHDGLVPHLLGQRRTVDAHPVRVARGDFFVVVVAGSDVGSDARAGLQVRAGRPAPVEV